MYPAFRDDPRYLEVLGNQGSNPLELFWDVVDSLDQKLDAKIQLVESAIARWNAVHAPPLPAAPEEKLGGDQEKADEDATKEKEEAKDKDEKPKEEELKENPAAFRIQPETTK